MHSLETPDGWFVHHNGDWSGDVLINVPLKEGEEETLRTQITLPGYVLYTVAAEIIEHELTLETERLSSLMYERARELADSPERPVKEREGVTEPYGEIVTRFADLKSLVRNAEAHGAKASDFVKMESHTLTVTRGSIGGDRS